MGKFLVPSTSFADVGLLHFSNWLLLGRLSLDPSKHFGKSGGNREEKEREELELRPQVN